jgi:DNA-binding transcriptional regulator YhcF (GntR family)
MPTFISEILRQRFASMAIMYSVTPISTFSWLSKTETELYHTKHDKMNELLRNLFTPKVQSTPRPASRASVSDSIVSNLISPNLARGLPRLASQRSSSLVNHDSPQSIRAAANSVYSLGTNSFLFFSADMLRDRDPLDNSVMDMTASPSKSIIEQNNDLVQQYRVIEESIRFIAARVGERHPPGQCDGLLKAILAGKKFEIQLSRKIEHLSIELSAVDENSHLCAQWIRFLAEYLAVFATDRALRKFSEEGRCTINSKYYHDQNIAKISIKDLEFTWLVLCKLLSLLIDILPALLQEHDKLPSIRESNSNTFTIHLHTLRLLFEKMTQSHQVALAKLVEINRLFGIDTRTDSQKDCEAAKQLINNLIQEGIINSGDIGADELGDVPNIAVEDDDPLPFAHMDSPIATPRLVGG